VTSQEDYAPRDWSVHPPFLHAPYKSTVSRAPAKPLVPLPQTLSEITGPVFGHEALAPLDDDLTKNATRTGEPLGERIIVTGRVTDEDGRGVAGTLIEVWQANAAGRYVHAVDQHDAPLDPNFLGAGRCVTDTDGRYRFMTLRPGCYPWGNSVNAWRPAHIHFSLFGPSFLTRLVTQMYFPGDPLLPIDPILASVPSEAARQGLVATFSPETCEPDWAIGYIWDIVLRGRNATQAVG
jgi:protocatechuate 3,4-dioxygenase beta subunit